MRGRAALAVALLLALTLRLLAAFLFPNVFWPDETYQSLEPAHRLAFGEGMVTWEWRDGLRSWAVPGLLAVVMVGTEWLGSGSGGYLAAIAILLSLLSLTVVLVGWSWGRRVGGTTGALLTGGLCVVWFDLLFFASKALTEVIAGHLLIAGIYLGAFASVNGRRRLFLAALLCGTAMAIRLQLAPAVGVALLCFTGWPLQWRRLWPLMLGLAAPVLAFGLLDLLTWGQPFHSYWMNYQANVVEQRSVSYGWLPAYQYAIFLLGTWTPVVAVVLFALALLGALRQPILALCALAILIPHSLMGHKEYRFVYPMIPMVLILSGLGASLLCQRFSTGRERLLGVVGFLAFFVGASVYAGLDFHAAKTPTGLGGRLEPISHWIGHRDEVEATRWLGKQPDLCGVALHEIAWQWIGGYAYLHRDVPLVPEASEQAEATRLCNYVLAKSDLPGSFADYRLVRTFGSVRVYRRDGACDPPGGYHVNAWLAERGI